MVDSEATITPCPECGQDSAPQTTTWRAEQFVYDRGTLAQRLWVSVPVRKCPLCCCAHTDDVADSIKDALIAAYKDDKEKHGYG